MEYDYPFDDSGDLGFFLDDKDGPQAEELDNELFEEPIPGEEEL